MSLTLVDLKNELWGHDHPAPELDPRAVESIINFETKWNLRIPANLHTIICWKGIAAKISIAFPTNNQLVDPKHWVPLQLDSSLPFPNMLRLMDGNEGCCYWYVGWQLGEADCHVFVSEQKYPTLGEITYGSILPLHLTADSLIRFLINYCRSGKEWRH